MSRASWNASRADWSLERSEMRTTGARARRGRGPSSIYATDTGVQRKTAVANHFPSPLFVNGTDRPPRRATHPHRPSVRRELVVSARTRARAGAHSRVAALIDVERMHRKR